MRASHALSGKSVRFDDPNLVSCAGLAPALVLARRCGLHELVAEHVHLPVPGGGNAQLKVPALIGGMVAGADSIDDMDLLRHGGMSRLFTGVRAPSTLGTFLRAFTFGHVRQLDAVAARFLPRLATTTPLLPGADRVAYVDVDDTVRETHGYAKQGAGYGYSGVKGLNALIATVSTPLAAPVIAATRLRRGSTNSARGAAQLVSDALGAARSCGAGTSTGTSTGAGGLLVLRADSAFYAADVIAAAHRGGARFSVTARQNPAVRRAIAGIAENAWTAIRYPQAVWDEDEQRWISDAEVAEVPFTAFTSRRHSEQVSARLIVRRVRRLNPTSTPDATGTCHEQDELFAAYRHHAVFTDSPLGLLDAETAHRGHAIIEQVIADLKDSALAHLPSGNFAANSAWLALAAMAFNLTRAVGALASAFHAHARTGTIRAHLIAVPGRLARSARRLTLHLPQRWPWQHPFQHLFTAAIGPPTAAS